MNFSTAVSTCFQKYATSTGRASRSEYWYFQLFIVLAGFAIGFLEGIVAGMNGNEPKQIASTLFFLATLLPNVAVTIRRLHDVDRQGWWQLLPITIIGIIPVMYWLCTRGTQGDNRFGNDPLAQV